jgi:small subunit ribosomal protein S3Ae
MAQTTSILKKKKKKWISIAASREFNNTELGETFVEETENVVGKVVCANMMNLVRDAKKQNIQLYFIVTHVKDNIANTELYGYEMVKERIDNSFGCVSKDNVQFKIKPILMTKGVAHKSVAISLRKKSEELIRSYAKQITFAEIMKSVIMGNMQKDLKTELKKIYPLNSCMIKSMKKISK